MVKLSNEQLQLKHPRVTQYYNTGLAEKSTIKEPNTELQRVECYGPIALLYQRLLYQFPIPMNREWKYQGDFVPK